MALVNVVNMLVLDNPANILSPFQFEITFECLQELEDDLEWKVVYVGSAQDSSYDQVLDEILVGPVPVGINKFVLQVEAPNVHQLPVEEILGVTVVLVTCSYKEREFLRVGYYVNNEYQYSAEELAMFQQAQAKYQQALVLMQQEQQQQQQQQQKQQEVEQQQQQPQDTTTTTTSTTSDTTKQQQQQQQQLPPVPQLPPPPTPLDFAKVQRHILADKPRVTKFPIPWTLNDITNTTTTAAANGNNNANHVNDSNDTHCHHHHQDPAMINDHHDENIMSENNTMEDNNSMEMSFVKDDHERGDGDGDDNDEEHGQALTMNNGDDEGDDTHDHDDDDHHDDNLDDGDRHDDNIRNNRTGEVSAPTHAAAVTGKPLIL